MREMLSTTAALYGQGMDQGRACHDGRFSGATRGFCVAMSGGGGRRRPIALVRDGDIIEIDAIKGTIDLLVEDAELEKGKRLATSQN